MLGDFNVQLPANTKGRTGRYVCAQNETDGATEVINLMQNHDLFAVNTNFRKRSQSPATYLHVKAQGDDEDSDTHDQYLGHTVKIQWEGRDYMGKIIENFGNNQGDRLWRAKFGDKEA